MLFLLVFCYDLIVMYLLKLVGIFYFILKLCKIWFYFCVCGRCFGWFGIFLFWFCFFIFDVICVCFLILIVVLVLWWYFLIELFNCLWIVFVWFFNDSNVFKWWVVLFVLMFLWRGFLFIFFVFNILFLGFLGILVLGKLGDLWWLL